MKKLIFYSISFITAAAILALTTKPQKNISCTQKPITKVHSRTFIKNPVVLELFTSQGCSSCPSADKLLGQYATNTDPSVIPIAFHVDYWNRLGWKDPFSAAAFSERQRNYANQLGREGVYTPQLVVNGNREMVGSDAGAVARAVAAAKAQTATAAIFIDSIEQTGSNLKIRYQLPADIHGATVVAVLVQHGAETAIASGENEGLYLKNYNIARAISTTKAAKGTGNLSLQLPDKTKVEHWRIVLLVQEDGGTIIAAATALSTVRKQS